MEDKGIKELLELLEGIAVLGEAGVKIAKDGIGMNDLPEVISLAKKFDVLESAVKGADEAMKEIKALDQTEIVKTIGKVYEIVSRLKEAS